MKKALLRLCLLPSTFAGLSLGLLLRPWASFGFNPAVFTTIAIKPETWPLRVFKTNGWVVGHVVFLNGETATERTIKHEIFHVRQFEAAGLACLALSIPYVFVGQWPYALAAWALGPWVYYLGGTLRAFLAGERPYADNHLEEAARRHAGQE